MFKVKVYFLKEYTDQNIKHLSIIQQVFSLNRILYNWSQVVKCVAGKNLVGFSRRKLSFVIGIILKHFSVFSFAFLASLMLSFFTQTILIL
jgi:hypothetical protein